MITARTEKESRPARRRDPRECADSRGAGATPAKHNLFGVDISAVEPEDTVVTVMQWARQGRSAIVDFMPVHGLIAAARDSAHLARMNAFDLVAPDGQPVRWALNRIHGAGLAARVYGPTTMLALCAAAADDGLGVYLYGGQPSVLAQLRARLQKSFPHLRIAGFESPPFRPLDPAEDDAVVRRINDSGAALVFLGLGCPKQEVFAFEHRHKIQAVQLCVGAAFDFNAGAVPTAPPWMQQRGLEWLFRLRQEPRRLAGRYAVNNSIYCLLFARHETARLLRRGVRGFIQLGSRQPAEGG